MSIKDCVICYEDKVFNKLIEWVEKKMENFWKIPRQILFILLY
jgi:hypothetical protein